MGVVTYGWERLGSLVRGKQSEVRVLQVVCARCGYKVVYYKEGFNLATEQAGWHKVKGKWFCYCCKGHEAEPPTEGANVIKWMPGGENGK